MLQLTSPHEVAVSLKGLHAANVKYKYLKANNCS